MAFERVWHKSYAPGVPAGTHNREILLGLGYTAEEIEEFKKSGLFD